MAHVQMRRLEANKKKRVEAEGKTAWGERRASSREMGSDVEMGETKRTSADERDHFETDRWRRARTNKTPIKEETRRSVRARARMHFCAYAHMRVR
eukprot:3744063-Pleurochrysis_carterae.AAC.3